ncbi:SUMF1/EgtB/PvdO family nonheme iron enzyme [Myxococcus sp. CA033]|nr:SUMF1/EgtB/PvdO family nonheme iron enzyme [Myxococcus sp. CA033]NTX40322.1 SUMF1/EgtB/PvdO family nonheme iron enzyme [Myxococcus sp. CA033]
MPPPVWLPPGEFDEYRLVRLLGQGAMGQVWLAQDTLLERQVAIKFLGALGPDVARRERFLIEARAIARLAHPNVVAVHRIGTIDGQPYMVTELIEGGGLDRLDKPIAGERALAIGIDLARGLAAAHRAGILHRDLKPANAMLGSDGAKLLDFGLAKFSEEPVATGLPLIPGAERGARGGESSDGAPRALAANPEDTLPGIVGPGRVTEPVVPSVASAALTQVGAAVGTPLYLPPECWRGEPATRRSDVYALGALLYELCAGKPPVRFLPEGPIRDVVAEHAARPLGEVAPQADGRLADVIDRCLERDPARRYASGDALREALERLLQAHPARVPEGNPYRGLMPFEAEHRALFFGRSSEVRAVVERLKSSGLVVVAGESGVGKSSLCRAGVLPAVREGALGAGRSWQSLTCLPGRHPLRALVAVCAEVLGTPPAELDARLRSEPGLLARELVRALGPRRGLVLFVDQLEEWASFADREEAGLAARAVSELSAGLPSLRVLATARSDLLHALTSLPSLGSELSGALFLLGPIQREHLRQLIEDPAQVHGVRFESEAMVQGLLEFAAQGGALPLIEFALERLWDSRGAATVLTEQALASMGGVSGALAQHADALFRRLPQREAREARAMLVRLVTANDQRRPRLEVELLGSEAPPARRAALATLARERIVMPRDSEEGTAWEIAHEVLLREWPALKRWLSEDAEVRAVRERLQAATHEWERLGRPADALWGGLQLADAGRVILEETSPSEAAFLSASRRRQRMRRLRGPLSLGALVLAGLLTYSAQRWSHARGVDAQVGQHLAESAREAEAMHRARVDWERMRGEAYAAFDKGDWPLGERSWDAALTRKEAWVRAVGLASARAENAFLLAPERAEVRRALARIMAERAELAELEGRQGEYAAELERLRRLDDASEWVAALERPANVRVEIEPPEATWSLTRIESLNGRWSERPAPIEAGGALSPGAYVLSASAPGFAPVRMPFVASRGKLVPLKLGLPPASRVPEGFVYVPAGPVLFGAAGDEKVRREFYEAAPLHPVALKAFLVGRYEVTFADWLAFLEELPAAVRSRHLPNTQSSMGGTTETAYQELARTARGWRFTFAPISQRYTALAGAPIRYRERKLRAEQDWLRFPVSAITPSDMEAYLSWLDATGRVPHARLCTEHEWERAARGADARTLPHGELLAPDEANIDETYGYQDAAYGPDEVGSHPASNSPLGVADMLGNAWEVVRSVNGAKEFVVRGGSWHVGTISARIPNSWVVNRDFRQVDTGFRVCADVP